MTSKQGHQGAALKLSGATSEQALAASPIRPTYALRRPADLPPEA